MRVGMLDCFAGISGDMMLGALVDVGVPLEVMQGATEALGLGASLRVERVDRSGIACTKVHVMEGEALADGGLQEPVEQGERVFTQQLKTQHLHLQQHLHHGGHGQVAEVEDEVEAAGSEEHGRSLTEIRALIEAAALEPAVKQLAVRTFELLGAAEAKVHNVPVEEIHFHEVGAVDAIVDIVAASAGLEWLKVGKWFCSALNVGGGMVRCAHGVFPVPAPATAELLRGAPTYSAHVQKELVTPTGAALVRALEPVFGAQPEMVVERIGYGAGTRNPAGFANVLRLSVGEMAEAGGERETVTVIETALDDLSPQVLALVAERALAEGALDVMLTPVVMKKGRPGSLLTVLCDAGTRAAMEELILRETSTLGLRVREERRVVLKRRHVRVRTAFGEVRVKVGLLRGEEVNVAPEFEDCKAAAAAFGVAVKTVQQAAVVAYAQRVEEQA